MLLATYGTISSHFGKRQDEVWLITSYHLGLCATQQLVSQLLRVLRSDKLHG